MAVYFMQRDNDQYLKIGYSKTIRNRISQVQSAVRKQFDDPTINVSLIGWHPGSAKHESVMHEKFAQFRADGEWFEPDKSLWKYIEQYGCPIQPENFTSVIYQQWIKMRELEDEITRLRGRVDILQDENVRLRLVAQQLKHMAEVYRDSYNDMLRPLLATFKKITKQAS